MSKNSHSIHHNQKHFHFAKIFQFNFRNEVRVYDCARKQKREEHKSNCISFYFERRDFRGGFCGLNLCDTNLSIWMELSFYVCVWDLLIQKFVVPSVAKLFNKHSWRLSPFQFDVFFLPHTSSWWFRLRTRKSSKVFKPLDDFHNFHIFICKINFLSWKTPRKTLKTFFPQLPQLFN